MYCFTSLAVGINRYNFTRRDGHVVHRHKDEYADSFAFNLQRWLLKSQVPNGVSPEHLALAQSAFAPFSVRLASSVGKTQGDEKLSIDLSRLVWLYEMRLKRDATLGEGSKR